MAFREDESRIKTGNAPEKMAVFRPIALNLLRKDTVKLGIKLGIKNKRFKAGWSTDYLTDLLWGQAGEF